MNDKTPSEHVREIEIWAQEVLHERPELDESEVYNDTVVNYIASEVGNSTRQEKDLAKTLCRMTGVSYSRIDW